MIDYSSTANFLLVYNRLKMSVLNIKLKAITIGITRLGTYPSTEVTFMPQQRFMRYVKTNNMSVSDERNISELFRLKSDRLRLSGWR